MSHALADLLANDHPLFTYNIYELEKAAGNAGIDVRLTADMREKAHGVMRAIGIDPADSSARELYHGLNSLVTEGLAENVLAKTRNVLIELDNEVVSLNMLDAIENAHHHIDFESRKSDHAKRNLRLEIVKRYAEHDRTDNTLVQKLAEQANIQRADDQDFQHVDQLLLEAGNGGGDSKKPTLLAIGDIFTDAFIELDESVARVDTDDNGDKRLSLPLGSKPPYKSVEAIKAVGPSPNAAVSCARLGLDVSLLSWLGDDQTGKEAIQQLKKENISTKFVNLATGRASNYYYVLRFGAERTILVKNQNYEYDWVEPDEEPDWLYLSLISEDSWQLHVDMLRYLENHPQVKLAFQPGTFHFKWGAEKLKAVYARSEIIVLNREEAVDITSGNYDDLKALAKNLHDLGPKIVVITDGPNGSYASYSGKMVTIPNFPDKSKPVDRTGAGDAFASTIVAGLALGKSMDEALTWAPINSASVVQYLGAQKGLLTKSDIFEWKKDAPANYLVSEL